MEIDIGVLFADVRGFTALSESKPPQEVARLLDRFYFTAATVLYKHDAVIDKFVGDEVMALFLTGFTGPACFDKMATAAEGILRAVGYGSREGPWLPLGVGMDFGLAFVGNVGSGEVKDFTAIGDEVNTAARLQGEAKPGQMIMTERVYQETSTRYPDAPRVELQLRGKSQPVTARMVEIAAAVAAKA